MNKLTVTPNDAGRTLLKFLQRTYDQLPLSRIERALREKDIKVNNLRVKDRNLVLNEGDIVEIYGLDLQTRQEPKLATKITFNVIFEDKNILIIEKPVNVSMHGDATSLDNQVLRYLNFEKDSSFIPSSIGRLDKITSGIVMYGKTYEAVRELNEKQNAFKKIYLFKSDLPESQMTTVKMWHNEENQKEEVNERGKEAITNFVVKGDFKTAELITGRKHQIRVTLAHLGYPIYGDRKYGGKKASRVFLHSYKLRLDELEGNLEYLNGREFTCDSGWN